MKEELQEKIDKLTAEWWAEYSPANRRQAFADQILGLFKKEKRANQKDILKKIEEILFKCECEDGDCPSCKRICGLLDDLSNY